MRNDTRGKKCYSHTGDCDINEVSALLWKACRLGEGGVSSAPALSSIDIISLPGLLGGPDVDPHGGPLEPSICCERPEEPAGDVQSHG